MSNIAKEIAQCGGIEAYLYKHQNKSLLRFMTCGSVDDGKSTLIGRLLFDSHQIYDDQLLDLQDNNSLHTHGTSQLDLSLLVDGLQDERAQGITIDVAYRYFFTKNRKFIIADTPGHERYIRNMVTGASTSNLSVLLIDVCKGIREQTRRHSFISILLGIRYLIIAVNKMDLVNYDQNIFEKIKQEYLTFIQYFSIELNIQFIPISALYGDNIIHLSKYMSWYTGLSLIDMLDSIEITKFCCKENLRFPVQYINCNRMNFRGYSGTVASGELYVGKRIQIFPSGDRSIIRRIVVFDRDLMHAYSGDAITIVLEDDLDISRGDLLLDAEEKIVPVCNAQMDVIWMFSKELVNGQNFDVKIANRKVGVFVKSICCRIDVNTFTYDIVNNLPLNSIGIVDLVFDKPIILDCYSYFPVTGSMIFIDPINNYTLGAGIARLSSRRLDHNISKIYNKFELELNALICRYFPHWHSDNLSNK